MKSDELPRVLVIAGHDPSGAGIHADIETCAALGCSAMTAVTALTVQNTSQVHAVYATDPKILHEQLLCIADDSRVIQSCKIGLVANPAQLNVIARFIQERLPSIPLVVDPVLKAGVGTPLADQDFPRAALTALIPITRVCTPNHSEALALTGSRDIEQAGAMLNRAGCEFVLITGADQSTEDVVHHLFRGERAVETYRWPRLAGHYHGSGCTLSSAIAANLALKLDIQTAIENAQAFTWKCLESCREQGHRQLLPNRIG